MAALTKERGMFELTLLNAEVSQAEMDDVLVYGLNRGIPPEIMTRLESLWRVTKTIAGEAVSIGKIVVLKIFEFMKANPNLAIGLALGAAVGVLVAMIPLLGALLAPLAGAVSMIYGGIAGASQDAGEAPSDLFSGAMQLARKFLELFQDIILAVKDYLAMVEV